MVGDGFLSCQEIYICIYMINQVFMSLYKGRNKSNISGLDSIGVYFGSEVILMIQGNVLKK